MMFIISSFILVVLQTTSEADGPGSSVLSCNTTNVNDDVINIIKKTVELCMEGSNVTSNVKPIK